MDANAPAMYCLKCRYPLVGLPTNRCPECGESFDVHDPETFWNTPKSQWVLPSATDAAGCALNFIAIVILLIEVFRPHVQSAPRTVFAAVFMDSFVWLGFLFSAASVAVTAACRPERRFLLFWRLAVLGLYVYILAAIVVNTRGEAGRYRRNLGRSSLTMAAIAIETFRLDVGRWPASLGELTERPGELEPGKWNGPYLKHPNDLRDAWGHPIRYRPPGRARGSFYDLWSVGLDGIEATEDDVSQFD